MYQVEQVADVVAQPFDGAAPTGPLNPMVAPGQSTPGGWGARLRALGTMLDALPELIRSVTVVDLPAGAFVNAIVAASGLGGRQSLRSFQFTNEQIRLAEAAFVHPPRPSLSMMRSS